MVTPTSFLVSKDYCSERSRVMQRIFAIFWNHTKFRSLMLSNAYNIVLDVEDVCYEKTEKYAAQKSMTIKMSNLPILSHYACETYRVISHLDSDSSINIGDLYAKKILNGELSAKYLAAGSLVLSNGKFAHIIAMIDLRNKQMIQGKFSTLYTCNNCGKNETYVVRFQKRANDEGESTFATCKNCKFVFGV